MASLFTFPNPKTPSSAPCKWVGKLGLIYHQGWGVFHDYVEAYKWYNLSTANGLKEGATLRNDLAKRMTPAQIAETQKPAQKWTPKGQ